MLMFLDQQVRAGDPRINAVYRNFQKNLADIIQAGHRAGAGIVVSTVAVNLRDSAPFASEHRPGLSATDKSAWDQAYQRGIDAQKSSALSDAAAHFREAAQIDDTFADLRFRQGQCELAQGNAAGSPESFPPRVIWTPCGFVATAGLNDIIRQTASRTANPNAFLLADAEDSFAQHSEAGLPGAGLFYEHVHLTFDGNYLLALTLAPQIAKLLPPEIASKSPLARPWVSEADCERRLAWSDWTRQQTLAEIASRIASPPFTSQLNHDAEVRRVNGLIAATISSGRNAMLRDARRRYETAVALAPDDPVLLGQLAAFYELNGDSTNAETLTKSALRLLPESPELWADLGTVYVAQLRFFEAADAFQRAFNLDSQDVWSLCNLAEAMAKLNRRDKAERDFRRALAIKPRFGPAWLSLGLLLEKMGRKPEADDCFKQALANRVHRAPELTSLARFCRERGRFQDAVVELRGGHRALAGGRGAVSGGRAMPGRVGPERRRRESVRRGGNLAPDLEEARFLYGLELGRDGNKDGAIREFREAVRIMRTWWKRG